MSSPVLGAKYEIRDDESGYASGSGASSQESLPEVYFTKPHLKHINAQLSQLEPQEILRWCITSLPGLYQQTAFGLSGLVAIDMLSKLEGPLKPNIDLIFLDTLYHFNETYALVDRIRRRYGTPIHIYKPSGCDTVDDFVAKHGDKFWETNEEMYDYIAKVEPGQRANSELQVKAMLTGRRRSQGAQRGDLDIVEVDDQGMIKVNPLANWSFKEVNDYIKANNVPYNDLLDRGYKSVGDWHSTQPVAAGEDERAGRWKGRNKTECGIHNPKSRYAAFLLEQEKKRAEDELASRLDAVDITA